MCEYDVCIYIQEIYTEVAHMPRLITHNLVMMTYVKEVSKVVVERGGQ
jgi:hypothetical protein